MATATSNCAVAVNYPPTRSNIERPRSIQGGEADGALGAERNFVEVPVLVLENEPVSDDAIDSRPESAQGRRRESRFKQVAHHAAIESLRRAQR